MPRPSGSTVLNSVSCDYGTANRGEDVTGVAVAVFIETRHKLAFDCLVSECVLCFYSVTDYPPSSSSAPFCDAGMSAAVGWAARAMGLPMADSIIVRRASSRAAMNPLKSLAARL